MTLLRLQKFYELLQDMNLYHDYNHIFLENGFDNWESISFLTADMLDHMGIKDEIKVKEILACVEAANEIKDEEDILNESAENIRPECDLIEEMKHNGRERSDSRTSTDDNRPITYHPLTEAIIFKGTSLKKDPKESNEKFFKRVIQLYLNEKGITHLENLQTFPNLQALYLYNNSIDKIANLDNLTNLTQLNLQGNFIRKMEGLQNLKHLKKLTLSRNLIKVVEGLDNCAELEELYISHQNIKQELQFDRTSLAVISNSLVVFESDGNKIVNPSPLAYLSSVRNLSLRGNAIENLEDIEGILACLTQLNKLDLRDNPILKLPKFRDQIVMMSPTLELLNDKKILANERAFLMKFYHIKSNAQGKPKTGGVKSKKPEQDLAVAGTNFKEPGGKENLRQGDGLNKAGEFYSGTVHQMSKKASFQ